MSWSVKSALRMPCATLSTKLATLTPNLLGTPTCLRWPTSTFPVGGLLSSEMMTTDARDCPWTDRAGEGPAIGEVVSAPGGRIRVLPNWTPDQAALKPTRFAYPQPVFPQRSSRAH